MILDSQRTLPKEHGNKKIVLFTGKVTTVGKLKKRARNSAKRLIKALKNK